MASEWQYRMPEDKGYESDWVDNTEQGALYLHRECGAELRTREVSPWREVDKR